MNAEKNKVILCEHGFDDCAICHDPSGELISKGKWLAEALTGRYLSIEELCEYQQQLNCFVYQ